MKNNFLKVLIAAPLVLMLSGCDRFTGRSVVVEFRNVEGVKGGEGVYFAGVNIGTTGEPTLVGGLARVPVILHRKHKDALPAGAVFLLRTDPGDPRKLALSVTACSESVPGQVSSDVYRGASSRLEFIAVCGMERAKQLWEGITK